jgi:16S rRNA (guanine1207-N2)-methyltransferase
MSRWANDPEHAADALLERSVDLSAVSGRVLLVSQSGRLPDLLRGSDVAVWNRCVVPGRIASPWPPAGPFDTAFLRLPKAREEQEMTVHAVLGVLAPGAKIVLYGGNDEGIRPAAHMLEGLTGAVHTLATRGHGRVLAATRPAAMPGLRARLADWRTVSRMTIGGTERDWVTYPGVFAAGRVDDGTALLLTALPALVPRATMLDFGCGSGVISAAALAKHPDARVDMLDNDSVALAAATGNVQGARAILGTSLANTQGRTYDIILSNPPLHQGIVKTGALVEKLIADAPAHLATGGILQMVVQRQIALERSIGEHLGGVQIIAEDNRYRVWRATRKA